MTTDEVFKGVLRKFEENSGLVKKKNEEYIDILDKLTDNHTCLEVSNLLVFIFSICFLIGAVWTFVEGFYKYLYAKRTYLFLALEFGSLIYYYVAKFIINRPLFKKLKENKEERKELANKNQLLMVYGLLANSNNMLALTLAYKGTKDFTEENQKTFEKEMNNTHKILEDYLGRK